MLHALVDSHNTIVRMEENIDPSVGTKTGYRWLPVIDIPRPSYNPSLQVARQFEIINEDNVTREWTIINKTEAEIEGDKINKINTVDPTIFTILLFIQNQIRESTNLDPLTKEEYQIMLKDIF